MGMRMIQTETILTVLREGIGGRVCCFVESSVYIYILKLSKNHWLK